MTNFIDELLAEVEEKQQQRQLVLDRLQSDQVLFAIAKLDAQIFDVNKLAEDETILIEQYRKGEIERIEKKKSWLLFGLEQFMRKHCESTGEKSVRNPHGVLQLRKGRDRAEIVDEEKFNIIAKRYGLLRTTPAKDEPDMLAILDHIKRTREIPLGVRLIPATVNFSYTITTNGDKKNDNE